MSRRWILMIVLVAVLGTPSAAFGVVAAGMDGWEAMNAKMITEAAAYAAANRPVLSEQGISWMAYQLKATEPATVVMLSKIRSMLYASGYTGLGAAEMANLVPAIVLGMAVAKIVEVGQESLVGNSAYYFADGTYAGDDGGISAPSISSLMSGEPFYFHSDGGILGGKTDEEIAWMFSAIAAHGGSLPGLPSGVSDIWFGGTPFTSKETTAFVFLYQRSTVHEGFPQVISSRTYWQGGFTDPIAFGVAVDWANVAPWRWFAQQPGSFYVTSANFVGEWTTPSGGVAAVETRSVDASLTTEGLPTNYSVGAGITGDSTVAEVLDAVTVPNVLPAGPLTDGQPGTNPGAGVSTEPTSAIGWLSGFFPALGTFTQNLVSCSPDYFADRIRPKVATLKLSAADHWPFAGGVVMSAVSAPLTGGGGSSVDAMEWYVDLTPPVMFGVDGGSAGVWIRPLTWFEPFRPYRWVLTACVGLGLISGLASLLRPKVEV